MLPQNIQEIVSAKSFRIMANHDWFFSNFNRNVALRTDFKTSLIV